MDLAVARFRVPHCPGIRGNVITSMQHELDEDENLQPDWDSSDPDLDDFLVHFLACLCAADDEQDFFEILNGFFLQMSDQGPSSEIFHAFDRAVAQNERKIKSYFTASPLTQTFICLLLDAEALEHPSRFGDLEQPWSPLFCHHSLIIIATVDIFCPELHLDICGFFFLKSACFLKHQDAYIQWAASRLFCRLLETALPHEVSQSDDFPDFIDSFGSWVLSFKGYALDDTMCNFFKALHLMCQHYPLFCHSLRAVDIASLAPGLDGCPCCRCIVDELLNCKKLLASENPRCTNFSRASFDFTCRVTESASRIPFDILRYLIEGYNGFPPDYRDGAGEIASEVVKLISEDDYDAMVGLVKLLALILEYFRTDTPSGEYLRNLYANVSPTLHDAMESAEPSKFAKEILYVFFWFLTQGDIVIDDRCFDDWPLDFPRDPEIAWDEYRHGVICAIEDLLEP
jgi:hypothetical protein